MEHYAWPKSNKVPFARILAFMTELVLLVLRVPHIHQKQMTLGSWQDSSKILTWFLKAPFQMESFTKKGEKVPIHQGSSGRNRWLEKGILWVNKLPMIFYSAGADPILSQSVCRQLCTFLSQSTNIGESIVWSDRLQTKYGIRFRVSWQNLHLPA